MAEDLAGVLGMDGLGMDGLLDAGGALGLPEGLPDPSDVPVQEDGGAQEPAAAAVAAAPAAATPAAEEEGEEEDEEDEGSDDEPRAKRARKETARLDVGAGFETKGRKGGASAAGAGQGQALGEMPGVAARIAKENGKASEALHKAHLLLFGSKGAARTIKKNILKFNGLPDTSEEVLERLEVRVAKLPMSLLKSIMDLFCIDRSAASFEDGKPSKENHVERFMEWVQKPSATTKKASAAPKPKRRAKAAKAAAKPAKAKATKAKAAPKRKRKVAAPVEDEESDSDDDMPLAALKIKPTTLKILKKSDINALSIRTLREEVAEELGIDITPFKAQIKQIATEYVASQ